MNILHRTNFIPSHELKCSLYLEPLPNGAPYILLPATFGAGMRGPFSLGVSADMPCALEEIGAENGASASSSRPPTFDSSSMGD